MNTRSFVRILNYFRLGVEREEFENVSDAIQKGIEFRSTNLWVLIFAIFIASLGLNVNSTAVIIGAMLISPLMGPIMGMGFSMAVNDLAMLKKSVFNYLFAGATALITSTFYFLITPISDAHSEILARTSPNIYDVLIALFGGLAGSLALASRQKGNVVPGVAIATALMPPLCTAGYGLATLQFRFFFGAFYLFFINTVFIALATLIIMRFLRFPYKKFENALYEIRAKRIIGAVVIFTLLPSIYLGYQLVSESRFVRNAQRFIEAEADIQGDYLLQKTIDPKQKKITLVYGGLPIQPQKIKAIESKLEHYQLSDCDLQIKQGFASIENDDMKSQDVMNQALLQKEQRISQLQVIFDSIQVQQQTSRQVFKELKALNESVHSLVLDRALQVSDSVENNNWLAIIVAGKQILPEEKKKIQLWLTKRVQVDSLKVWYELKE
ncbi:TIGR00341 family protein [Sediminibacterium sp.]|uniref:TIGR00341 family protein n=1 Tax=Sediminibacterium sp. TaxID=1917865 RepID=UPI0025D21A73|nr:TIGR00341 family protein [Sediminibacterium sp.]MBW0178332.1 TIGR00341 family protein [Sediminibacterium sp.]